MATEDISRSAFYPGKRYAGVRMQQGRVLTDDDFNESQRIQEEEQRITRVHSIGPYGSPDEGFRITGPERKDDETIDFQIKAGNFYVGGLRLALDVDTNFQEQKDWLGNNGVEAPANTKRYDLVYLEAWQQPVSAVEDNELFEVALGGPDTSTRLRNMCRVRVEPGVIELDNNDPDQCATAWDKVVELWKNGGLGELSPNDHELVSDARLKVGYIQLDVEPSDLCASPVAEADRYLGAENQAIRVHLVDENRFTWGFDNGAPLYRVQVEAGNRVTMITLPKDQAHWPMGGQVVELLSWSSELVNGEKIADELGPSHLCKVEESYDPDTDQFSLSQPLPSQFGQVSGESPAYFFLRIWDRGPDHTAAPAISIGNGPMPLGTTGLTVTFTGDHRRRGDYWIIAARPETANRVVPWELEQGRLPHGLHRFAAPLALLQWKVDGGVEPADVVDCREVITPCTKCCEECCEKCSDKHVATGFCCSITVGGSSPQSIQEAINGLPDGGEVCVLPGDYAENVTIDGKHDITIRGCGALSKISSGANDSAPVFRMVDASGIRIESLAVSAHEEGAGVLIETVDSEVHDVTLADLSITAQRRSAIELRSGSDHSVRAVTIRDCRISMDDLESPWPGIFVIGEDVLIANNAITVGSSSTIQTAAPSAGRGGVQIGGTSERIRVIDNLIQGGIGNGITLGSLEEVDEQSQLIQSVVASTVASDNSNRPADVFIWPSARFYQSPGFLYDIRIERNRILNMGLNGIGVVGFFGVDEATECITVVGLTITDNEIRGCLHRQLAPIENGLIDSMAYGAIALADVEALIIRNNIIEDNGAEDPVNGIFVLLGEGIEISSNRMLHKVATAVAPPSGTSQGRCGGINIVYAVAPMVSSAVSFGTVLETGLPRQNGIPALTVHDNTVSVPRGQALAVTALGPVTVRGNQFTTRGVGPMFRGSSFIGSTVAIVNLGVSNEIYGQLVLFSFLRKGPFKYAEIGLNLIDDVLHMVTPTPQVSHLSEVGRYLANGNIMFTNNQCTLDLLESGPSLSISSIYILSLDDVAFHDNQCDCSVLDDIVISQAILLGFALRVSDNRFKEGFANTPFSAFTVGFMNMTTNNQATHCLVVLPPAASSPKTIDTMNTTMMCPTDFVTDLLEWARRWFFL